MASVELRGLTKRYGDAAVVDNVSLSIEHGHLVCLLGPSGCGKTTTLRLIAGVVEPSAGEIRVGDRPISSPEYSLPPERQLQSAIRAVHPELEDASRILGATRLRALWQITAPLLRTSVTATWCFIFVGVVRELSAAIMLFTSQTKVLSVLIYDLNESGDLAAIAVLGVFMLLVTSAVVILANSLPAFGARRTS